jgi:hypothetical protein
VQRHEVQLHCALLRWLLSLGELRIKRLSVRSQHLIAWQRARRKDDLRLMMVTTTTATTATATTAAAATATAATATTTTSLVELLPVLMVRLRLRLCLTFTHDGYRVGF